MTTQDEKDWAALGKMAAKLKIPEGFTGEWQEQDIYGRPHYRLYKNEDMEMLFYPEGDGTTKFRAEEGWRTFDRRGIEASFYWKPWTKGQKVNVQEVVDFQIGRVAERRAFIARAVTVPEIGYMLEPGQVENYRAVLRTGKSVHFHPAGMGTGKELTRKRPNHRYGVKRAGAELEKFMGVGPLWVVDFDAD